MIRPRIRLTAIFVFLALICIVLAYWTASARRQRNAVAELRELGCHVGYSDTAPWWLRRIVGDDLVSRANLVMIDSANSDIDASVAAAMTLPQVDLLWIWVSMGTMEEVGYAMRLAAHPNDIEWMSEVAGYDLDKVRDAQPNCRILVKWFEYEVRPQAIAEDELLKEQILKLLVESNR